MNLSLKEKMLFSEALIFQFIAGLILKLLPFRMIPRLFALSTSCMSPILPLTSQDIKRAILISGRLSPWKNKCLVQSLAARWMLNLRSVPSKLSFGVALGEDQKVIAHAWLKTGDFEIVEKNGDYNELYFF